MGFTSFLRVHIEEIPSETGYHLPLGRHIFHDSRSRDFEFNRGRGVSDCLHRRVIPILDQGQLGSCTGNAGVGALGSEPFVTTLPPGTLNTSADYDEKYAVGLYGDATQVDNVPGSYPPDDTGSTGLAIAKVLKSRGLISGYQHTFSLTAFLAALTLQPVIVGMNWYSSFDSPGSDGKVDILQGAYVRGGHEVVARGIDTSNQLIWFDNSWGEVWGRQGSFLMPYSTMDRLLAEQGDVTVLVPTSQPAPTPTPTPTPTPSYTPADLTLRRAQNDWARAKGLPV